MSFHESEASIRPQWSRRRCHDDEIVGETGSFQQKNGENQGKGCGRVCAKGWKVFGIFLLYLVAMGGGMISGYLLTNPNWIFEERDAVENSQLVQELYAKAVVLHADSLKITKLFPIQVFSPSLAPLIRGKNPQTSLRLEPIQKAPHDNALTSCLAGLADESSSQALDSSCDNSDLWISLVGSIGTDDKAFVDLMPKGSMITIEDRSKLWMLTQLLVFSLHTNSSYSIRTSGIIGNENANDPALSVVIEWYKKGRKLTKLPLTFSGELILDGYGTLFDQNLWKEAMSKLRRDDEVNPPENILIDSYAALSERLAMEQGKIYGQEGPKGDPTAKHQEAQSPLFGTSFSKPAVILSAGGAQESYMQSATLRRLYSYTLIDFTEIGINTTPADLSNFLTSVVMIRLFSCYAAAADWKSNYLLGSSGDEKEAKLCGTSILAATNLPLSRSLLIRAAATIFELLSDVVVLIRLPQSGSCTGGCLLGDSSVNGGSSQEHIYLNLTINRTNDPLIFNFIHEDCNATGLILLHFHWRNILLQKIESYVDNKSPSFFHCEPENAAPAAS